MAKPNTVKRRCSANPFKELDVSPKWIIVKPNRWTTERKEYKSAYYVHKSSKSLLKVVHRVSDNAVWFSQSDDLPYSYNRALKSVLAHISSES